MKIAQIAPLVERVPAKKYGGTERVISHLTEELVRRGHQVTLFASGDSVTSARLVSPYPTSLREGNVKNMYGLNPWTILNISTAYAMQDEFDVIHDHSYVASMPAANVSRTPVVMTLHNLISVEENALYQKLRNPYLVTISNDQAENLIDVNHAGTVYNGLAMEDYPTSDTVDDYLLFVGRVTHEKGVHYAIEVAQRLDMKLVIAAKVEEYDKPYFKEFIEPKLDDKIQWVGEVDEHERNKLMSRAVAFLHPVTYREPFGLSIIESMACGTPVVAFARGSIPEIIQHGKTGFVVETIDEMTEAVKNIDRLDRDHCREYALSTFNAKRMAEGYEAIYKKILNEHKK